MVGVLVYKHGLKVKGGSFYMSLHQPACVFVYRPVCLSIGLCAYHGIALCWSVCASACMCPMCAGGYLSSCKGSSCPPSSLCGDE